MMAVKASFDFAQQLPPQPREPASAQERLPNAELGPGGRRASGCLHLAAKTAQQPTPRQSSFRVRSARSNCEYRAAQLLTDSTVARRQRSAGKLSSRRSSAPQAQQAAQSGSRTSAVCPHGCMVGFERNELHASPEFEMQLSKHTNAPSCDAQEDASEVSLDVASQNMTTSTAGSCSNADCLTAVAYLQPPSFPGTYPSISFCADGATACVPLRRRRMLVRFSGIANAAIRRVFVSAGFSVTTGPEWDVLWGPPAKAERVASFNAFQKHNHFPGTWQLGRKDHLYKNVARMRRLKGTAFDFIPSFHILPHDWLAFQAALTAHPKRLWIRKPLASSRGRGVGVLAAPEKLAQTCKECLVQHYIRRPLLIDGRKFDLRLYVAVTSFCPLRAYLYPDGLARFATKEYSTAKDGLKNKGVHLTNVSINKTKAGFNTAATDGLGSKWSLGALWQYLDSAGVDVDAIWRRIHDVVALTLLAVEPQMGLQTPSSNNANLQARSATHARSTCFEVFGFDVLLDERLKVWLIEVNTSPSLGTSSAVDKAVKEPMLAQLMHMVGVVPYDRKRLQESLARKQQKALLGLQTGTPEVWPRGDVATLSPRAFAQCALQDLPDVVRESEAEWSRCGAWQPCLPVMHDPKRHAEHAQYPRREDVLLRKWLQHKAGTWPAAEQGPPGPLLATSRSCIGSQPATVPRVSSPQTQAAEVLRRPSSARGSVKGDGGVRQAARSRRTSSRMTDSARGAAAPVFSLPRATQVNLHLVSQ